MEILLLVNGPEELVFGGWYPLCGLSTVQLANGTKAGPWILLKFLKMPNEMNCYYYTSGSCDPTVMDYSTKLGKIQSLSFEQNTTNSTIPSFRCNDSDNDVTTVSPLQKRNQNRQFFPKNKKNTQDNKAPTLQQQLRSNFPLIIPHFGHL